MRYRATERFIQRYDSELNISRITSIIKILYQLAERISFQIADDHNDYALKKRDTPCELLSARK